MEKGIVCEVRIKGRKCGYPMEYIYYNHPICEKCWQLSCKEDSKRLDLKEVFGIKE